MTIDELRRVFGEDEARFAMIEYALTSGEAEVLHADKDGISLIYNGISMVYGAKTEQDAERLLRFLINPSLVVCSSKIDVDVLRRVFPDKTTAKACYQVKYTSVGENKVPAGVTISKMEFTRENVDLVFRTYTLGYGRAEIEKLMKTKDFFAASIDGEIIGYIGAHEEGSLGLLEVFPRARGLGVGSALLTVAVNNLLSKGEIAYSNIVTTNEASLRLHARLGYYPSDEKIYWCW